MAHLLKHHKNDCIGLLIGSKKENTMEISDAIPLFHDHVFSSTLEVAMEMVDTVVEAGQIVGVYDAPVRARAQSETRISPISSNITE